MHIIDIISFIAIITYILLHLFSIRCLFYDSLWTPSFAGRENSRHLLKTMTLTATVNQLEPFIPLKPGLPANATVRAFSALVTVTCLCATWIWPRAFLPKLEMTMQPNFATPSFPWPRHSPFSQWWHTALACPSRRPEMKLIVASSSALLRHIHWAWNLWKQSWRRTAMSWLRTRLVWQKTLSRS